MNIGRVGLEYENTHSDTSGYSEVQCAIDGVLDSIFMAAEKVNLDKHVPHLKLELVSSRLSKCPRPMRGV